MKLLRYLIFVLPFATACSHEEDIDYSENKASNPFQQTEWNFISEISLTDNEKNAADAQNRFSYEFMKEVSASDNSSDICISPVNMAVNLGMLANATSGEAHRQILDILHVGDLTSLNSLNRKLLQFLPCEDNGSCIAMSNRFWVADRYNVPEDFIDSMLESYNAPLTYVDFSTPKAIDGINGWVAEQTKGLIPSILDQGWEMYRETPFVCVNTSYFKGLWEKPFSENQTYDDTFNSKSGSILIPMMHQESIAVYAEDELIRMVSLNFNGNGIHMELYLPKEAMDMHEMAGLITPERQRALISEATPHMVQLALPSFKSENTSDVGPVLMKLGLTEIDNADFSPMGIESYVINMLHKTYLKLDESGAEAAAVTGTWMSDMIQTVELPQTTIEFNRPFFYIIRHTVSNSILLTGIVNKPSVNEQ